MKRRIVMAIGVATILATVAPGAAETIQRRDQNEQNRIEKGEKKGQLTPKESQRLEDQQKVIDQERSQAGADGKMTKREKKDIKHDQKRLNQDIEQKRHNKKHD